MRALLSLSEVVLRFPRTAVLVLVTLTAGFVVSLGDLELRTDAAAIYPLDNRTVRQSDQDLVLVRTLGTMALCGIPVTPVTTVVPVALMAMAVKRTSPFLAAIQAANESSPRSSTELGKRTGLFPSFRKRLSQIRVLEPPV